MSHMTCLPASSEFRHVRSRHVLPNTKLLFMETFGEEMSA